LLLVAVFLALKRLRIVGHISVSVGCWGSVGSGDLKESKNLGQGFNFTKTLLVRVYYGLDTSKHDYDMKFIVIITLFQLLRSVLA
jgi:hypothetical protein